MATSNTVKVIEFCRVAPPPGLVTQTSLSLTFFDLLWMHIPPPQFLYFYDYPHPKTHFTDSFIPRIKHSLSVTLQHFYPMAGNLVWPLQSDKPMINYVDGDSVSLIIAESEDDFYHLSGDYPKDAKESHPLVPHLQTTGTKVPLLALQATLFPNSGICIGLSMHHAAIDGKTIAQFMKSWASVCRLGDISLLKEMIPFYDRKVIKDPNGLERIYLADLLKFFSSEFNSVSKYRKLKVDECELPPNMFRATFEISQTNIAKLKKWVLARCNNNEHTPPSHVSTFVVTSAYVWTCLVKAGGEASKNIAFFGIVADYRPRIDPPIPSNYFGNCIGLVPVITERKNIIGQDGIVRAVELIQEAIKGLDNGLFSGAERWLSNILSPNPGRVAGAAGSPQFRVYTTDFGLGKPKKVEMMSIDRTGAVCFYESGKGDGGVEISLVLNKSEMDAFASVFINDLNAL